MSTGALPALCCGSAETTKDGPACANSNVQGRVRVSLSLVQMFMSAHKRPRRAGMSYNHGLLLSGASLLFNATKDERYLQRARSLLAAALANMTTPQGVLQDVQRGYRDAGVFPGSCKVRLTTTSHPTHALT